MKKLKCGLIVSDFDGTFANSKNEVDECNVLAVNRYVNDGGIFTVCTGRILSSILPRVRALGLKGLVAACQGSVIADIITGEIVRNVTLSCSQTAEICATLEEVGTNVQMYDEYGFYSDLPADEKHLNTYEDIIGVKARHANLPLSEYVLKQGLSCHKVATMCRASEIEVLYNKLKARLGDRYDVTCSASVLIEVSPFGETKGKALKFLADHYGVPISRTCAIGDNLNDLSMLDEAGYGVAVGNCAPQLLERVKYVTVSNDEGAVERVIRQFGYGEL